MNKSRGRPPGRPDTRARIVAAARPLFLAGGYRGTTIRAVAAAAEVDSALISYHFGSKQGLFAEAMRLPCADPSGLDQALRGDRDGLADRLLAAVTRQWDAADPAELVLVGQDDATLAVLREYLDGELRVRIAEFLGGPGASSRATAAVGVLGGLIFTRYLGPLASVTGLPADDVHRVFGPALRAALRPPARRGVSAGRDPVAGRPG